ncbi:MAG: hypothetical protein ACRDIY_12125 [Chloroflexota bacterium]
MSVKSWNCPGCHREFIVEAEAMRDTCPWCNQAVEDKEGDLQVVADTQKADDKPPGPSSADTAAEGNAAGPGPSSSGTGSAGTQSWWPFEYSS